MNEFFPFSAETAEKGKTSRFAYYLCMEQAVPIGHEHFSLSASSVPQGAEPILQGQRQRKKYQSSLCSQCLSGEIEAQ
jgi:hypothetical protein